VGIRFIRHCSEEARNWIVAADIVLCLVGNPFMERWLATLNGRTVSLQHLYKSEPDRPAAYAAMVEAILTEVRKGKTVCAVFYGHPGVFVSPSHAAIRQARAEGHEARMLPAISAEDCLWPDLGVDPGVHGCQSYEARDFFIHERIFDPSAALILWQIAVLGDDTFTVFEADPRWLEALADVLCEHYPADHIVTVYEAAVLPTANPRVQELPLRALGKAAVTQASTLFVPPVAPPQRSAKRLALLRRRVGKTGRRTRPEGTILTALKHSLNCIVVRFFTMKRRWTGTDERPAGEGDGEIGISVGDRSRAVRQE
jgi:uncharacterized protein YabN with tetrapyrrole methylase and pyrophosphatase domain